MSVMPTSRDWSLATQDLFGGMRRWRIWWLLGIGDIRQRYSRSRFGQFWITMSMAIFVVAIGLLYAVIFKQPINVYLPYIASTYVVWVLISGIILESTTAFTQAEGFLRQAALPKTVFVLRVLVRNFVSFAHNLIIVPLVFIALGKLPTWTWLLIPVGLALVAIAGGVLSILNGLLCARFRDLPQVIGNVVQIAFFVTPVTWPVELIGRHGAYVVGLNPFAAFLNVVSQPLRGEVPSPQTYLMTLLVIACLAALGFPLFARFRARITYYL